MNTAGYAFSLFTLCSCAFVCAPSYLSAEEVCNVIFPDRKSTKKATKMIISSKLYDFSGFYIGVLAGYNQMHSAKQEVFINFNETDPTSSFMTNSQSGGITQNALSGRGILGGAHLGYGKQFGQFYIGAQVEGNLSRAHSKQTTNIGNYHNLGLRNLTLDLKRNLTATLRTGFTLDKTLIYAKAGAALGHFHITSFYPSFRNLSIGQTFSTSKTQIGAVAGVGVDVAATKNIVLGGEVNYTQYKNFHVIHPLISTTRFAISVISFQLKLSYKL